MSEFTLKQRGNTIYVDWRDITHNTYPARDWYQYNCTTVLSGSRSRAIHVFVTRIAKRKRTTPHLEYIAVTYPSIYSLPWWFCNLKSPMGSGANSGSWPAKEQEGREITEQLGWGPAPFRRAHSGMALPLWQLCSVWAEPRGLVAWKCYVFNFDALSITHFGKTLSSFGISSVHSRSFNRRA